MCQPVKVRLKRLLSLTRYYLPQKVGDGRYHMFASRWTKDVGFGNWVTNSKVVRAVADTPVGPYEFQVVVLPIRGKDYFDGMCTHNPRIIKKRKNEKKKFYKKIDAGGSGTIASTVCFRI